MNRKKFADVYLEKRILKYDAWLREGHVAFSSRVIPVAESLEARQWVLPTEQVREMLADVEVIALQPCECRSRYQRCDHPREVCLLFDQVAEKFLQRNEARKVTFEEASEVLEQANCSGLVHLALYMPNHKVYALCSCCTCCCHEMQIVREYCRNDFMVHSEYVSETDFSLCIYCHECVNRCMFGARLITESGEFIYEVEKCLGCGLCVTVCPVNATIMKIRNK